MGGRPVSPRNAADDLTLREAAEALGLSVGTVRGHVKAGRLRAATVTGKFGPEYRLRPAVVARFAADRYGLRLDPATMKGQQGPQAAPVADDMRELYERLLAATADVARFKALAEQAESTQAEAASHYQAQIAELRHERDAAQAQADEAAAELARVRGRSWWARVFGGAG